MSERYECIRAEWCPVSAAPANTEIGLDTEDVPALILGDPNGTALVLYGTRSELATLLARASLAIDGLPR